VDAAGGRHQPPIMPDLYVTRTGRAGAATLPARPISEPMQVVVRHPEEIRQRFLEIRDSTSGAVVAVIELLSPTNKWRGGKGRRQYLRKRRETMASPVHWLEIDLLRAGERPLEVAGQSDYYALLKRGGVGDEFSVWFFGLRDPLPVVAVPLAPPHADVALDLHAALAEVYERHYADRLDYAGPPPPPPLPPADAAWVAERIHHWRATHSR
jgi:hypothetical protein